MYNSLEALAGERKAKRILIVGCGSSAFTEELYNEGFTNITNIDISAVVINQVTRHSSFNDVYDLFHDPLGVL